MRQPDLRRAMAARARARIVAQFTLSAMGDRMAALLERACERARAGGRPAVGPGLALEYATLAIEYGRMAWAHLQAERRAGALASEADALEREVSGLRARDVTTLSGERLGHAVSLRRLVQALGFRLAATRGLGWLSTFRVVGRRLLGD
jgi:hypothetical protein